MAEITFTKVRLEHGWLGNMSPHHIMFLDLRWPTAEHLFQALRYPSDDEARELIRAQKSPMSAKMEAKRYIGRQVVLAWSDPDVDNMRMVLKLKLEQHPELKVLLKATGDATIIEDCSSRANLSGLFWGAARDYDTASWQGQNTLGKLWMELRAAL